MSLIQSDVNRVVVGLGVTGVSTMRFLLRRGIAFSAADTLLDETRLQELRAEFPGVRIVSGDAAQTVIDRAHLIYLSPGIAIDSPIVRTAVTNGARISGDLDLFFSAVDKPVAAITGTNGKSTVTSLVGELIAAQGLNVAVGGNIGEAMLDIIDDAVDCYVLELSSFQLERAGDFAPDVACILNITADHIDRHKNLLNYHQAKQRIYKNARIAVFNRESDLTRPLGREDLVERSFGEKVLGPNDYGFIEKNDQAYLSKGFEPLFSVSELKLQGQHNALNAMAALVITEAMGFNIDKSLDALRDYSGLPHRCVLVACDRGVRFIDDSKATNVGSTVAAIDGLRQTIQGKLVLIAGGLTKGTLMQPLAERLASIECRVVLIGRDAPVLREALSAAEVAPQHVCDAGSMREAVSLAVGLAESGDVVLLSPACASMDMFENYQARGHAFMQALSEEGIALMPEVAA